MARRPAPYLTGVEFIALKGASKPSWSWVVDADKDGPKKLNVGSNPSRFGPHVLSGTESSFIIDSAHRGIKPTH